ncbi:CD97 antigen-like [Anneissia japonica]|uniref:CD97 antigen-like n=1 Tax=Anneissia japonica TaxID=1529436 RepID=UPI001425B36C|nr:CD97 antigen-like [Anneissia japonica]
MVFASGRACLTANPCQNGGTCITEETGSVFCFCVLGYHGTHCNLALNVNCGQNFYGVPVGHITSPNYPDNYDNFRSCGHLVGYPNGKKFRVIINDMDIEEAKDVLEIGSGSVLDTTGASAQYVFSETLQIPADPLEILGSRMWVYFYSDFNVVKRGFNITFLVDLDDCNSDPCQNGGLCIDGDFAYTCVCQSRYTGTNCEINVDECASSPCVNGVCSDGDDRYFCACSPGWSGTHCEININECSSNPCLNNANCNDDVNRFDCICQPGYAGVVCKSNVNECSSNPCQFGSCIDGVNGFFCQCFSGYSGTYCEYDLDDCNPDPCHNDGICIDDDDYAYTCVCQSGYTGTNCEAYIGECASSPCNNGMCAVGVYGYICTCNPGWSGVHCDKKMCYKEVYDDLTFPDAKIGETVDSEDLCGESKTNYLMPLATRTCKGEGAAMWEDPEINDCGPDATTEQLLERLNSVMVKFCRLKQINDYSLIYSQVTQSIIMVVNNLLGVDEEILMESQMRNQAPTKITEVLEGQLGIVELNEKGIYEETTPNIAVQAQMFDATQISEENMINLTFISESNKNGVGAVKVLANGVKIPDAANVSIALPISISDVISANNITDFRIIVIVYNDSRLFQSAQFINDRSGRRPNSQVISLSVPGLDRVKLDKPIVTTFIPIEISETNRNTTCVFWDFILDGVGGWSTEGCTFVNGSEDGSDRQYCECTHLTNFAILMDFHQMSSLPPAADIVTIVGLSISIASLFLTLLTFLSKRKFWKSEPKQILCQLCLSLLGLYIVFLAGIDRNETTENSLGCTIAAALLHYFLLSSIFWMNVQAVKMYYLLVKVVNSYVSHFLFKACLFAWGLPAIIVSVSAFVDLDSYVDFENYCFLTLQRMYYSVAIPVALSLLFNMTVFIRVLHSLRQLGKNRNQSTIKGKETRLNGIQMMRIGVTITAVFGLTWLIGFFSIGDASEVMLWIFCILNSFQGLLIFVFMRLK